MATLTESETNRPANRWLTLPPDVVIQSVWRGRLRILVISALFAGVGVIVALCLQPEFISEAKIMPEMNNGSGDMFKRLASVAGFAGMDLSDAEGVDAVRPDLYPNVLQSTPFVLQLIDKPIITTTGQQATVGQFLLPDDDRWSLKKLLEFGRKDDLKSSPTNKPGGPVRLTSRQQELVEDIGKRISAKLDTRSGIITITAKMPDANVAASVAQLSMDYLTQYVTNYRTEKARQDLQFYTQRLHDAQKRYQTAQFNVFQYNDQHKYYVVQAATMDKQRREAELSIAQTVYSELSRQFEQAKLKLQERTPIFKVLEPAQVPLKRTSPKRAIIVLVFSGIGLLTGIMYVLARQADVVGRLRIMVRSTTVE